MHSSDINETYFLVRSLFRLSKRTRARLWLMSLASSSSRPVPSPTFVLRRLSIPWPGNQRTTTKTPTYQRICTYSGIFRDIQDIGISPTKLRRRALGVHKGKAEEQAYVGPREHATRAEDHTHHTRCIGWWPFRNII